VSCQTLYYSFSARNKKGGGINSNNTKATHFNDCKNFEVSKIILKKEVMEK
jgi:hypothetical protein